MKRMQKLPHCAMECNCLGFPDWNFKDLFVNKFLVECNESLTLASVWLLGATERST